MGLTQDQIYQLLHTQSQAQTNTLAWLNSLYGDDPFSPGTLHTPDRRGLHDYWSDSGALFMPERGVNQELFVSSLLGLLKGDPSKDDLTRLVHNEDLYQAWLAHGSVSLRDKYLDIFGKYSLLDPQDAADRAQAAQDRAEARAEREEARFRRDHATTFELYNKYFQSEPTAAQILDIEAHGSNRFQWETYIRTLPSHLPGVSIGQYLDTKNLADAESQKIYNHPASDGNIQDLINLKYSTDNEVQSYYIGLDLQPGKNINPVEYNKMYKSAEEYTQAVWNDVPNPNDLWHVWQKAGQPGALQDGQQVAGAPEPSPAAAPGPQLSVLGGG